MPGPIRCVTVATSAVVKTADAYTTFLDYQIVAQEPISAALAASWDAPAMVGREQMLLAPKEKANRYLRLVDIDPVAGYEPLRTLGWNAIEIIVRDTDAMARRLADSPFEIVGPPENLSFTDAIRAMQAIGPSGEMVYLTMSKYQVDAFDMPTVEGDVAQPFIVIAGGNLDTLRQYYHETMKLPEAAVMQGKVTVLSRAYQQSPETLHDIAAMPMGDAYYIELDQYPDEALARPRNPGQLPAGQSIVTFDVTSLDDYPVDWRGSVAAESGLVYNDARSAVTVGPAGEWIELVERRAEV